MNLRMWRLMLSVIIALGIGIAGCNKQDKAAFMKPTLIKNAPPPVRLAEFANVELQPMQLSAGVTEQESAVYCQNVAGKINVMFEKEMKPILKAWNSNPNTPRTRSTLVVLPILSQLRWESSFSLKKAKASIVVEMALIDKSDGTAFAKPFFYAGAVAGSVWDLTTDKNPDSLENGMLAKVSEMMAGYIAKNYASAVGGFTGSDGAY